MAAGCHTEADMPGMGMGMGMAEGNAEPGMPIEAAAAAAMDAIDAIAAAAAGIQNGGGKCMKGLKKGIMPGMGVAIGENV